MRRIASEGSGLSDGVADEGEASVSVLHDCSENGVGYSGEINEWKKDKRCRKSASFGRRSEAYM